MSLSKRLILLVAVLLGIGLISSAQSFNLNQWLEGLTQRTAVEQTTRVVSEESAVIEVVNQASPSVVSVLERSVTFNFFTGPQTREASIGTGFVVGENLIVTNRHVVNDTSASYSIVDKEGNRHEVSQIYRDQLNDLALLRIQDGNFAPLELGDSDQLQVGQTVIAIGNALGRFENTVTKGVVSGIGRGITASNQFGQFQQQLDNVIQTDAALNPGNSGGPLLNIEAQVIGVNVAVGSGAENIGFSIPINEVKSLIEDFAAGRERKPAFLGVEYVMITEQMARSSDFPAGALVRSVVEAGAAEEAGVKVNDVITQIDEDKLNQSTSLARAILKRRPGDQVRLTIWRDGETLTFTATLQEAN